MGISIIIYLNINNRSDLYLEIDYNASKEVNFNDGSRTVSFSEIEAVKNRVQKIRWRFLHAPAFGVLGRNDM